MKTVNDGENDEYSGGEEDDKEEVEDESHKKF
jgi:hypothetical protein